MSPLVNGRTVFQLKAGAGVIDFVKIGAVIPARFTVKGVLFINQVRRIAV